jgi:catechol 2,3-dioxygenase-like lactoylglutathione lyase family enzyme
MKRTSHIAVRVSPERAESAIEFYSKVLGLERKEGKPGEVGLHGENFVLWVDSSESHHVALQEFAGKASKQQFIDHGCEVFDETPQGFHVRDPFGLSFHVWTAEDAPE